MQGIRRGLIFESLFKLGLVLLGLKGVSVGGERRLHFGLSKK